MQQYSQAVIYYNLMEVDRNDISVNISDIGKSYESILDGISYGKRNIRGSSSKNEDAIRNEQHNAQEIEWLNRKANSIADKLSEYMDDLWGIHKNKVIPFENTDDDFKGKAWDLYWKYNGLGKWLGDFFGSATEAIKNLLRGAIDGIMDIVESTLALAKGILLYAGSAAILIATDKMPITCKWVKNHFNDTNNKIGAILSDPEVVLDGIAQGASDTVDNKGIFYSVGYIIPSVFGEKGLDKVGELAEGLEISGKVKTFLKSPKMGKVIDVIDESFNKLNTKVDHVKLPEETWGKTPTVRGKDIDDFMENNVGSNYPVIDRIDENGIVTSVKSRDLNCKSYQNGKTLENTIKKDIDKLSDFNGLDKSWNGVDIGASDITGKQLQMVVPNTKLSEIQIQAINNAISYGGQKGINIIITVGR